MIRSFGVGPVVLVIKFPSLNNKRVGMLLMVKVFAAFLFVLMSAKNTVNRWLKISFACVME